MPKGLSNLVSADFCTSPGTRLPSLHGSKHLSYLQVLEEILLPLNRRPLHRLWLPSALSRSVTSYGKPSLTPLVQARFHQ